MQQKHFHPMMAALFLRKTLVLYLLPLARVALARDWAALGEALRQDAALFALLAGISWALLHFKRWGLDEQGVLHLFWTLGLHCERAVPGRAVAALAIERPLLFRLTGASRVTLYFAQQAENRKFVLYLSKHDAEALAGALLPAVPQIIHRAAGTETLALAVLGANGLSTFLFLWFALRESRGFWADAEALAYRQVEHLAAFAARWLPAGAAWLLAIAALLSGASLVRSAAQTARHEAFAGAEVLGCRSGLVRRYEYRIRRSALSYADMRLSPAAYLLRRRPVYVAAGSFKSPLPLLICRAGNKALPAAFLPGFAVPPVPRADLKGRNLAFFFPAGGPMAFCLLLAVLARSTLPALALPLLLLAAWFLPALAMAAVGYRQEGVWPYGGHLTLRRQRGAHLHCICVLAQPALVQAQNPWAAAAQRANLTLCFAPGVREKVRSIPYQDAAACFAFFKQG